MVISFREVVLDDAQKILDWRTSPRVTKFMNTDLEYDLTKQQSWLESVYDRPDYYPWVIEVKGVEVGLLYIEDLDFLRKQTSWGFYIGDERGRGAGGLVPPIFYNFAFDTLGVETIFSDVLFHNTSVIDLHLKQGHEFDLTRTRIIEKNGAELLVVGMCLKKSDFKASKLSRLKQKLPTKKWRAAPHAE